MQGKLNIAWLTLGQRSDKPEVSFEEMRYEVRKTLDALKNTAKGNGWKYAIYGTVANIHGGDILSQKHPFHNSTNSDGTRSELADYEVIDKDIKPNYCRYHVHMAILAKPCQEVAKFIMNGWPWGAPAFKVGDAATVFLKTGKADRKGPKGVYDLEGLFDYIDLNHDWSQRKCRFARHCPSFGRVSNGEVLDEIREGYENLTISIHNPIESVEQDGTKPCDALIEVENIPF